LHQRNATATWPPSAFFASAKQVPLPLTTPLEAPLAAPLGAPVGQSGCIGDAAGKEP